MIVYRGRQLVIHHNEGDSPYLLVAFNQLNSEYVEDENYFLRPQVKNENISCLSVMTTEKMFYITPEIADLVSIVDELRGDRPVIVFGQSMGGFAALKHSGVLKADYVIALSPYYSVDPDDLDLPSERHRRMLMHALSHFGVVFSPELSRMGIVASDVSGRLAMLYDQAEFIDAFDAELIRKHLPQIESINVPHVGHVIYDATWSGEMISSLMSAIQNEDRNAFARQVRSMRRQNEIFISHSLAKAARRKPLLCARATHAPRLVRLPGFRSLIENPLNLKVVYSLIVRGQRDEASEHFAYMFWCMKRLRFQPVPDSGHLSSASLLAKWPSLVLSVHGAFLGYDIHRRLARFEPHIFEREDLLPIIVKLDGDTARFTAISAGREFEVSLTENAPEGDVAEPVRIVVLDPTQIALEVDGRNLGAEPTGGLYRRSGINHEQRLVIIPLRPDASILKVATVNWFDKIEIAPTLALPVNAKAPPAGRKVPGWRKIFSRT
jgi:pimeloyl-ACP methyl ester carboxylesterase